MPNALTNIQVPAQSASTVGVRQPILESYVFASGIHDPEVSSILTYKYPQYYLTSFLDRIGAEETTEQKVFSWFVQDRTRQGSTVVAITSNGGDPVGESSVVFTTGFTFSGGDLGYLIVGDVIRLDSGVTARVTATAEASGAQSVTVSKVDGTVFASGEMTAADSFGHSHSSFGEYSDAPNGRLYTPDEEFNTTTIIRRSFAISGDEFTNRTYLKDGKSWFFEKEAIEMKELARDKENAVMFGQLSTGTVKSSKGVLDYAINEGINNGYAAASGVTESDLQEHIKDLLIEGASSELTALCGAEFLKDAQIALRDYATGGGTALAKMAGLDFQEYKFLGKTIKLVYYELFNDVAVVPFVGTASASKITFSDFSLWVDGGKTDAGESLIKVVYKEHNGNSRKFIHAYETGMMNPEGSNGGQVSNGKDGFTLHYLIECGVKVLLPNKLGILRATS